MPLYSFRVRTGDDAQGHDVTLNFRDLKHAVEIALLTMVERSVYDVEGTFRLADSALEIVNEAGQVVASLPIADVITRH